MNASLTDFKDATTESTDDKTSSPSVKRDAETPTEPSPAEEKEEAETDQEEQGETLVSKIDLSMLDTDLAALLRELSDEEIRDLVTYFSEEADESNLLTLVKEATDDEEPAANIDSLTDHIAERPSMVEAAGTLRRHSVGCSRST